MMSMSTFGLFHYACVTGGVLGRDNRRTLFLKFPLLAAKSALEKRIIKLNRRLPVTHANNGTVVIDNCLKCHFDPSRIAVPGTHFCNTWALLIQVPFPNPSCMSGSSCSSLLNVFCFFLFYTTDCTSAPLVNCENSCIDRPLLCEECDRGYILTENKQSCASKSCMLLLLIHVFPKLELHVEKIYKGGCNLVVFLYVGYLTVGTESMTTVHVPSTKEVNLLASSKESKLFASTKVYSQTTVLTTSAKEVNLLASTEVYSQLASMQHTEYISRVKQGQYLALFIFLQLFSSDQSHFKRPRPLACQSERCAIMSCAEINRLFNPKKSREPFSIREMHENSNQCEIQTVSTLSLIPHCTNATAVI